MKEEVYIKMAEVENTHWWFVGRTRIVKAMIDRFVKDRNMQILDMGCGSGNNFRMLSLYGEVSGLEPDSYAVSIALKRNIAKNIIKSGVPYLGDSIKKNSFHLITLTDVLEHIQDDEASLENISQFLRDDGTLIITVPAFMFLWSIHDTTHLHFRRYRLKELESKLLNANYKIEYISYYNTFLFPIIAFIRLIKKAIPFLKDKPDLGKPNIVVNSIMKLIFSSEKFFLGRIRFPFGVSIIAVAKKIK